MKKSKMQKNSQKVVQIKNKENVKKTEQTKVQEDSKESIKSEEIQENDKETAQAETQVNDIRLEQGEIPKSIKHLIKKTAHWTSKALVIISGFGVIYFIINLMSNFAYKSECENFYGIPSKYFSKVIDMDLAFIVCTLVLVISSFIPLVIKCHMLKNNEHNLPKTISLFFIGFALSLLVCVINAECLSLIFINSKIPDLIRNSVDLILNHVGYFYLLIYIVLFVILFIVASFNFKNRISQKICFALIFVFLLISFFTIIFGIAARVTIPIDDKNTYEIVSLKEDKYVVLSEYDNKNLCVKYDVDSDQNFTFYTGEYYFLSRDDAKYSYVTMNNPPQINKDESYVYDLSK